ncbi:DUF4897 domain-containing protein [Natronoarchaeum sp. GCM10025703]|uniref:DUF4897 domain-containing protein n=1 Tax=Natronoarchaeum sp. GCM10025703 TaxID=3252685 RepID=UPI0036103BF8
MDPSERTTGRRIVAVGIAVLLVTTLVAGSLAAGAAADQRSQSIQQDGTQAPVAQEEFDADDVRLTVDVDDEGTATWTVEYWKRLDDDESTTAFESIETDVEENPQEYVDEFAASMDGTVASATNSTGREMAANDYTVSTRSESIPQEYGVLTYSFEWSGFAAVDGERLEIGDAISGFFLDDQTRLVVAWPGEYELVDVQPEPTETREGSVLWQGSQTSFVGDEPRVVVSTDPGAADALGEESGLPLAPGCRTHRSGAGRDSLVPLHPRALGQGRRRYECGGQRGERCRDSRAETTDSSRGRGVRSRSGGPTGRCARRCRCARRRRRREPPRSYSVTRNGLFDCWNNTADG